MEMSMGVYLFYKKKIIKEVRNTSVLLILILI